MGGKNPEPGRLTSGRKIAFLVLECVEKTGRPADEVLEAVLARHPADLRETGLAFSLIQGVLRWRGYLDGILEMFSSKPVARTQRQVLLALRLALFQLLFLDRIPAHAAINESILLLKRLRLTRPLTGFVNGVLRAICRTRDHGDFPPVLAAHHRLSHPRWLYERYLARHGREETEILFAANNTPADLHLAVAPGEGDRLLPLLCQIGIDAVPGHLCPDAILLRGFSGSPVTLPGFAEGLFHVQDQGAQLIPYLACRLPAGPVLDGCAGLGGKTIGLARLLGREHPLVALEPNPRRYRLLAENLARTGLTDRVTTVHAALQDFAAGHAGPAFRAILLDAPCSGLGVIRRHPEIRWLRRPEDLRRYQATQLKLLAAATDLLAPGGILVYATCSTEPEENEEVIRLFLARRQGFAIDDATPCLPAAAVGLLDATGCLRTLPGRNGCDGFFAARLRHAAASNPSG